MTDTMSSAGQMDISLKDNGLIVDMSTTASLLHHNTLSAHAHALRSLKEHHQQQQQQQQLHHHHSSEEQSSSSSDNGGDNKPQLQNTPITANVSISPTNLSTNTASSPSLTTFRCESCDNFETSSRASLLLHVVQCLSNSAAAARLKNEDVEPENLQNPASAATPTSALNVTDNSHPSVVTANSAVVSAIANGSASSPAANSSTSSQPASRKVFECDVCNMKFSNGANMRRHKMRHTGVKPYECRVCQKRFFRKDHLAEHFTTHTKTLPYHCPICNRGFQRQIAMRAHFQNEHVGQHDLVKTCPLCSYRAGSMKSLRIHFFNRHGIDLDNPGPGGSSSLLLALESQASQVAAAAAAAGFVPTGLNAVAAAAAAAANAVNSNAAIVSAAANSMPSHQSDSGESLRSVENATPPMHFLTPHVEISTLPDNGLSDNAIFNVKQTSNINDSLKSVVNSLTSSTSFYSRSSVENVLLCVLRAFDLQGHTTTTTTTASSASPTSASTTIHTAGSTTTEGGGGGGGPKDRDTIMQSPVPLTISSMPPQEHPLDCNAKSLPSSTSSSSNSSASGPLCGPMTSVSPKQHHHENHITPSISLIPIKQEPPSEDSIKNNMNGDALNGGDSSESEFSAPNMRLTSLIKMPLISYEPLQVSPLKSLLREDLKRRICAKANNRITRNAASMENNNVIQSSLTPTCGAATSSTPICNGTITSTGPESDSGVLNRKQILTCLFCGIEFPDETLYFLHKGCHCESNPWKCNICGEQLNNVYEFNAHLLSKSHQ
ncbi:vascular endothelial zinc finger 1 isoform X2 [Lucilia sericata]|nr:vascular endothelial zinc finger 1 isoform X2 [Lucilia sericata]XP_037828234.1 vascular endothelial zinc finger 1 isoform X2 [Lucilia sericata]XP_037828235.1 vascular endothelial zinc finger 1 isoform X2 [Lucilia sericata]XP_037828236.1 vascular endothelial zinc finger 1 isoform X2 [Lucilia sericata]